MGYCLQIGFGSGIARVRYVVAGPGFAYAARPTDPPVAWNILSHDGRVVVMVTCPDAESYTGLPERSLVDKLASVDPCIVDWGLYEVAVV